MLIFLYENAVKYNRLFHQTSLFRTMINFLWRTPPFPWQENKPVLKFAINFIKKRNYDETSVKDFAVCALPAAHCLLSLCADLGISSACVRPVPRILHWPYDPSVAGIGGFYEKEYSDCFLCTSIIYFVTAAADVCGLCLQLYDTGVCQDVGFAL